MVHEDLSRTPTSRRAPLRWRLEALAALLLAMLGATVPVFAERSGESVQRMTLGAAVATGLWWCLPVVVHVVVCSTKTAVLAGGIAIIAAAPLVLPSVYESSNSTAGFGIAFTPAYLVAGSVLVLAVEQLLLRVIDAHD